MPSKVDIKAAAIILIKGNKALLNLRDDKPNISYPIHWGFAGGGRVEIGETYLQAAKRELKEETGYISKDPIYFMTSTYTLPNGKTVRTKRFFEIYDGVQEINCYEGQKTEFLTAQEIDKLNTFPGVAEAVKEAIEKASFN